MNTMEYDKKEKKSTSNLQETEEMGVAGKSCAAKQHQKQHLQPQKPNTPHQQKKKKKKEGRHMFCKDGGSDRGEGGSRFPS